MFILNFLLDLMPWYLWLVLAAVAVFFIYRYFGVKVAAGAAAFFAALVFYKQGRQAGRSDEREQAEERDQEHANDIREDAADARADSDRRNANADELRKPDGFQRD